MRSSAVVYNSCNEHIKSTVLTHIPMLCRVTANGKTHGSSDGTSSKARNVMANKKADESLEHLAATGITPAAAAAAARAEGGGKAAEADGSPVLTREEVVHEFFSYMFPDTFQLALPVLRHKVPAGYADYGHLAFNTCSPLGDLVTLGQGSTCCCMSARLRLLTLACGFASAACTWSAIAGGGLALEQVGPGSQGA